MNLQARDRTPVIALLAVLLFALIAPRGAHAQEFALHELARRNQQSRHQLLITHGVNTDAASLLAFLETGFSEAALRRGLPNDPRMKGEIANAALQELGFLQAPAAVPVFIGILEGNLPQGAQRIINRDVEVFPIEQVDEQRGVMTKILRLNAIVALGLIGDRSAADAVFASMQREVGGEFVTEGAIALALLEDNRGLAPLVGFAGRVTEDSLRGTFATVFVVTGRNYGITESTSIARRRVVQKEFENWAANEGRRQVPSRADVLRRRTIGYIIPPPTTDSVRGLLKASRTFNNYDIRYAARQRLQTIAPSSLDELRTIATDPMEDLDVRWAAMDWYAATNPREARGTIRDIARRDENPSLRQRAELLRDEIEIVLKEGKRR